jgi:hypothetical protein
LELDILPKKGVGCYSNFRGMVALHIIYSLGSHHLLMGEKCGCVREVLAPKAV